MSEHNEHVTASETWPTSCLEGECEHRDEEGQPEDMSVCPSSPYEVCIDCMDEGGFGRDPLYWDDAPLSGWPHEPKPEPVAPMPALFKTPAVSS